MALQVSTGLRTGMMDTGSFKSIMDGCTLKIYSGTPPADADAALSGNTLLCEVFEGNDGSTPLTFEASASNGVILKNAAEVWEGTNAASGTASFYRLELAADTGLSSTTEKRVQGTIANAAADLNLTSTSLVLNASQKIDYYSVALPTL